MEATQLISNSILESDEEENEEENENEKEQPFAKLCILKNNHIPETDLHLFLGDNVLGRDPSICTLPLSAASVSKQHATICISAYRRRGSNSKVDIEALVWDLGSMNGTRKGRLKLTPNVRYALSDGDSLLVADIPCQYNACDVDSISRNLAVKERLPGALERKEGDTSSKKCVSGDIKAVVSSSTTPARTTCLSFEQTPTQPQGTLVPESDSDSDGERRVDRRHKALVSSSDSHKSSPNCSTFISPTNKIVPESEDESPITPSSATLNRPHRHVSISMETQLEVGRQLLEGKKAYAVVHDCENEERTAPDGKSGQLGLEKQHCSASPVQEDVLSVFTTAITKDPIPEFNMNSDTDMEGEEEGAASVGSLNLNTEQVDQPPNSAQFHMDSDTDVDENEDTIDKAHKTVPSSDDHTKIPQVISDFQPEGITVDSDTNVDEDEDTIDQDPEAVPLSDDNTKPTHDNSVIQPEGITVDSDTDVDDDAAVSDAATKAKPMSLKTAQIADSAPVMQPNDFHLDSDTDVDEEEDMECQTNKPSSKIDETSPRLDIKPIEHDSAPAAPHRLHLDSDTDDEILPAPAPCEPVAVSAAPDSCTTTSGGVDILCDSDTDVDDDCPVVKPAVVRTSSVSPGTRSEALESVSKADTDVDGSSMPPVGDRANPPDLERESNRDEEDKETAEGQIPSLCRGKTPGSLFPHLQNCSTPVQSSEDLEVMETQAFLCPSSAPFKSPVGGSGVLSSCSDSQDEDFVVAETQSFILQTRDGQSNPPEDHTMEPTQAFALEPTDDQSDEQSSRERSLQLGLSDSSHLECQAQVLATENTQVFIPADQSVNMEEAHTHSTVSSVYRTPAEINLNMEATQLHGMNEEPARCSAMSIKEDQVALALEQTQTYTSEPHSNSEKETDEDEKENMTADAETQPLGFPMVNTFAMAETQPLSAFEGNESLAADEPVSGVRQASPITQNETRMKVGHEAAAHFQQRPHDDLLCLAETQPMNMCEDEESNDEDAIAGPQHRKANQLQLTVEQAQLPKSYNLAIVDTQPVATSENEESDDGDLIPFFRRRAKPVQIEEETQHLSSPEVSATETKPSGECKGGRSDKEDLSPRPQDRKERRLQLEEEQTQPIVTSEEEERNNENLIPGPPSAVDTKSLETQTGEQPERKREGESEAGNHGVSVRNKRGTRATFREAEEQAECSEPPKIKTRGKNKALTTTRGRRGKSRPDENESEEELEEKVRGARGKRSSRQWKPKEEGGQFKMEKGECAENNSRIKEEQEGELEEEGDVTGVRHHSEEMEKKKGKVERKHRGEEDDILELERKEKEEQERLQAENTERIRLEQERTEKERKEFEEKERLEHQRAERAEKQRIEKERKEQEQKERLDKEKQELEERLERERKEEARLQREERERLQKEKENREKQVKGQQKNKVVNDPKVTIRGRKAARRTVAAPCTTEREQDLSLSTNDDFPAKRTRSRSNSSNSVSSERSASSLTPQEARGRSGGRGNTSTSKPPQATTTRSRGRRRTVASKTPEQDSPDISPREFRSRSNSSNSFNTDISSCSMSSQNRGRGNRQQGRLRKTEPGPVSIPPFSNQSVLNSTPKPAARGRKSRKIEGSSHVDRQEDEEKADSQPAVTTRGHRVNANISEPPAANEEDKPNQEEGAAHEDSPLPKRIPTGRSQKAAKRKTSESPLAPAVRDGEETKDKIKGSKRELETKADEDSSSSAKVRKGKEKAQKTEAADEEGTDNTKEIPPKVKNEVRASVARPKKNAKESPLEVEVKDDSEKIEDIVRKVRGRPSAVQKKKKEEQTESGEWKHEQVEASEPQTPTPSVSRKRQAPVNSSPVAKTPRSSSASPAARGRQQAASQAYKVLFTGLVDEEGERVLARLRGSMAKGVADMNCLVTDKVRRTVKFLCAVAKGIPIVTTQWLEKSGKAGSFLSPNAYVVKDSEQEKKFGFCLKESLRTASNQPLLQGYEIHVTKSVKPEPAQMKDIISCSGATFLPKMPSSPKPQTVVISCEEDWLLCGPAVSVALPVVTAEFILTGILQQKVDFQTHSLSLPITNLQLAGRGKGRKKP